jgi:ribosome-associated protein
LANAEAREAALLCVRFALEKKAYDLVLIEVGEMTALTDYFLICTGRSDTQVQSIARGLEENLERLGIHLLALEGFAHGQWVLMDFGEVVVHIFYEPVRGYYDLERLWSQAPRVVLPEPYRSQARELRLAAER